MEMMCENQFELKFEQIKNLYQTSVTSPLYAEAKSTEHRGML